MTKERIGRYELRSELGRGGMAIVYLAYDPQVKRQVAVKVLPRQYTFDPQFRSRFQQEAEVIATLEHPAIIPIYDFGEHEDQPYIVMRYMPGGSLAGRIDGGPLPVQDIVRIITRLAPALEEAHERGILHRDLKPGNILFDQRGEAYVADFGIARLAESSAAFTGSAIIGTPAYMSPEQARGQRDLDGRSDIYSLGVILYEMLTGKLPYEADTPMGLAIAHVIEPVPDVRSLRRDLPEPFSAILARALAKDRTGRYPAAGELAVALDAAARVITTLPVTEPPPADRPPTLSLDDAAEPPSSIPPTRTRHQRQGGRRASASSSKVLRRSSIIWVGRGGILLLGTAVAFALWNIIPPIRPPAASPDPTATATLRIPPSTTPIPPPTATATLTRTPTPTATATRTSTPTATSTVTNTPTPPYISFSFSVPAEQKWVFTGLVLQKDQVIEIVASGTWTTRPDRDPFGPEGFPKLGEFNLLPNAWAGKLVGKTGSSLFEIGARVTVVVAESGELALSMNDSIFEDNSGVMAVTVIVYP